MKTGTRARLFSRGGEGWQQISSPGRSLRFSVPLHLFTNTASNRKHHISENACEEVVYCYCKAIRMLISIFFFSKKRDLEHKSKRTTFCSHWRKCSLIAGLPASEAFSCCTSCKASCSQQYVWMRQLQFYVSLTKALKHLRLRHLNHGLIEYTSATVIESGWSVHELLQI